MNSLTKKYCGS